MATADKLVNLADLKAAYDTTLRVDAAQTLTDAQKAQARANVGAVDAADFNNVNFLVDYNSEANEQTTTHEGISITRCGTRLTLNGKNETGGLVRVRMCGSLYACTGNISGEGLNAPAVVLQSGHSYILNTRLVSGSVSGDADREYIVFTSAMLKSTGANYTGLTGNLLTTAGSQRRLYVGDGTTQVLIVFGCFNNTEFTNATYEITLEDITVEPDWDYPLMVSRGNANFFGNGYGPESIGVDAALTYSGATVDFIGGQAIYHGTYYASNASTYFSVSNGIQTQGGSAKDAFLHPNTILKAGRTYKLSATVLSGSVTGGSETNQPALQYYYKTAGGSINTVRFTDTLITDLAGASYPVRYEKYITPSAQTQIGFGIWMRSPGASYKETYNNLRVVYTIEETDTVTDASTAPVITAAPGGRYVCSASSVTELSFTPSSFGICSVRFKSGSTATVLTLPNTVKMPDWWTGPEANRYYEISIEDGVYGVVTSWA